MSKGTVLLLLVMAALFLAGCGAFGTEPTPTLDGARPAPGGTISGAEGTAEPDAPTPTPTLGATPTPVPTKTPLQVAEAFAVVEPEENGTYNVLVTMAVPKLGLSGVDLTATLAGISASIESIEPGDGLGSDALVATEAVDEGGTEARVAFARRGTSEPGQVDAEVALLTIAAEDIAGVLDHLAVEIRFTDAGLVLHGPIVADIASR